MTVPPLVRPTEEHLLQCRGEIAAAVIDSRTQGRQKALWTGSGWKRDLFDDRQVQPHFINACCFGEDFAGWLKQQLSPLAVSGYTFSESIQEDYGWGFWASHGKDRFWLAISYVGDGPQEPPAEWIISVNYGPGLNPIKRLLHKPDATALADLRDRVRQALAANAAIRMLGPIEAG